MHSFEVHSNESACRKSRRLGLEQVLRKNGLKQSARMQRRSATTKLMVDAS